MITRYRNRIKQGKAFRSSISRVRGSASRSLQTFKKRVGPSEFKTKSEPKYVDTPIAAAVPVSGVVDIRTLTLTAQGLTAINRIGNLIQGMYVALRMSISMNATSTASGNNEWAVVLVLDKCNNNGTAPTWLNVFQTTDPNAFPNRDNTSRFVILKRIQGCNNHNIITQTAVGIAASQNIGKQLKWHINLRKLRIRYDGTGGTQADASENHIYLMMHNTNSAAAGAMEFDGNVRFAFADD